MIERIPDAELFLLPFLDLTHSDRPRNAFFLPTIKHVHIGKHVHP